MILSVCPNPSVDVFVWIDAIHPGKVNRATLEDHFPGGKGVHVALACAEMGEEVTIMGCWGGPTGEWIKHECLRKGIQSTGIEVPEWSRICQSFKSEGEFDETEILGVGPAITSQQQDEFIVRFRQLLPAFSSVSMSGSWPQGSSPDVYARLIQLCQQHKLPVFLDCSGRELELALKVRPYAVHVNSTEAGALFGRSAPEILAAELAGHCSLAAITVGVEGLYLTDGKEMVHGKVDVEHCFSAVGSGDCLMAGLMIATQEKLDLHDSARMGVACGAANCLSRELGILRKTDVDALYPRVKVKPMKLRK